MHVLYSGDSNICLCSIFILIPILDSPEIEVDQSWIRTPDGIEAEVSCNIHAEPKAEVRNCYFKAI